MLKSLLFFILIHSYVFSEQSHLKLRQLTLETHLKSKRHRQHCLKETIQKKKVWPHGPWGEILWSLSALYLNQKTDTANQLLYKGTQDFLDAIQNKEAIPSFKPETSEHFPWSYFALNEYVRILYFFHENSSFYPGRLSKETEEAIKKALWHFIKKESIAVDAELSQSIVLLGTENHDLTQRANYYLISAFFEKDPSYRDLHYNDGLKASDHAKAYRTFYRTWPQKRVRSGLWFEVGSSTYQKYSYPALFNLHELSPDPFIREQFGMYLDLAFIEEAQISIQGRRGGGRSRASHGPNSFENSKNILYADGKTINAISHSKILETSHYQLPSAAIAIRNNLYPANYPFHIQNRVLGEYALEHSAKGNEYHKNYYHTDSRLLNYAWRTSNFLLGSTQLNPALSMTHPKKGTPTTLYGGISSQKRWAGVLIDTKDSIGLGSVYTKIEQTRGGRPQNSFWSLQHKNVLLLQRIAPQTKNRIGSYSTGKVGIGVEGSVQEKVEMDGWLFLNFNQAYVGIKFLDTDYTYDSKSKNYYPKNFEHLTDKSRILIHCGDLSTHATFLDFQKSLQQNPLTVQEHEVHYQFGKSKDEVVFPLFDNDKIEQFASPKINGQAIRLQAKQSYESPYLNGSFNDPKVRISVGPIQYSMDFSKGFTSSP